MSGEYETKDPIMVQYAEKAKKIIEGSGIEATFQHILRNDNSRADELAKLVSKPAKGGKDSIIKTTLKEPSILEQDILPAEEVDDWRTPIFKYLAIGALPSDKNEARKVTRRSGRYFVRQGALYGKNFIHPGAKCIAGDEISRVLTEVHEGPCASHQGPMAM